MQVYDDSISIHQESLGIATPFRPSPTTFRDVLLHFPNTAIGAGRRKALGLNAHDLRMKIFSNGRQVVAIDRSEESLERFSCGFHGSHYRLSGQNQAFLDAL